MTPHSSLRRAKPLPCGCLTGPGILLTRRCAEAEALWAKVQALGDAANSTTEEWKRYREHFRKKGSKR